VSAKAKKEKTTRIKKKKKKQRGSRRRRRPRSRRWTKFRTALASASFGSTISQSNQIKQSSTVTVVNDWCLLSPQTPNDVQTATRTVAHTNPNSRCADTDARAHAARTVSRSSRAFSRKKRRALGKIRTPTKERKKERESDWLDASYLVPTRGYAPLTGSRAKKNQPKTDCGGTGQKKRPNSNDAVKRDVAWSGGYVTVAYGPNRFSGTSAVFVSLNRTKSKPLFASLVATLVFKTCLLQLSRVGIMYCCHEFCVGPDPGL